MAMLVTVPTPDVKQLVVCVIRCPVESAHNELAIVPVVSKPEKVAFPFAVNVVNDPAAGAVPPIAGGEAR